MLLLRDDWRHLRQKGLESCVNRWYVATINGVIESPLVGWSFVSSGDANLTFCIDTPRYFLFPIVNLSRQDYLYQSSSRGGFTWTAAFFDALIAFMADMIVLDETLLHIWNEKCGMFLSKQATEKTMWNATRQYKTSNLLVFFLLITCLQRKREGLGSMSCKLQTTTADLYVFEFVVLFYI